VVVVLIDLGIRTFAFTVIRPIFERIPPFAVQHASPDPAAIILEIPAGQGLTIRGSLYRHTTTPPLGLIIFCPEMGGNHWSAMTYGAGLWNAGFDILAFDFRSQGESDSITGYQPLHWLTDYEVDDVLSVIDFVQRHPDYQKTSIGLLGISRGGGAALAATAKSNAVESVACEGAFSTESMMLHYTRRWAELYVPKWLVDMSPDWHIYGTLQIVRWVTQFRRNCRFTNLNRILPQLAGRPVLIIAGERDTYVQPVIAQEMVAKIASNSAELWMVPGAKHNQARTVEHDKYDERLVSFFSRMPSATLPSVVKQ